MRRAHLSLALARLACAACACLLAAAGCRSEEATAAGARPFGDASTAGASSVPPDVDPPVTHGAINRGRTAHLDAELQAILQATLPTMTSLLADLDTAVTRIPRPAHLATTDPVLKTWRQPQRDAFQALVDRLYDEAEKRVQALQDAALAEGLARARERVTDPSPLDAGATGESSLDNSLETFNEVVTSATRLKDLSDRKGHDRRQRVDLFEAFSTFGAAEAEAAMGGRILLFVGGEETSGAPAALLAFRADVGTEPTARAFVQVFRHRIMRGGAVVKDLGWRLAPIAGVQDGRLHTETLERFLLAPDCQPTVDTHSPTYEKLRDMRIVVDVQSAVLDAAGKLLGGVDWRLEFQVSARGDLTWQLAGGKPIFDKGCAEVAKLMAH